MATCSHYSGVRYSTSGNLHGPVGFETQCITAREHARTPLISPLRAHKSEKNDPVRDGVTISLLAQGPRTRAAGPQRAAARAAGAGVSK